METQIVAKIFWKTGGISSFIVGIEEKKFFPLDGGVGIPKNLFIENGRVRAILYSMCQNSAISFW